MEKVKKIVSVVILLMSVFFIFGQNNKAEAYDVYLGDYSSGYHAYLMTDTIVIPNVAPADARKISCTVKGVLGDSILYITYNFYKDDYNNWKYYNSQGYSGYIDSSANISRKALYYILGY